MIKFCFYFDQSIENLSGFDLGDIDIIIDGKTISSRGRNPDQSMMLFLTVDDLLDNYRKFLLNKGMNKYTCIGSDSSFAITFIKVKSNNIIVKVDRKLLYKTERKILTKQIFVACEQFLNNYIDKIPKDDVVMKDLNNSFFNFKEELKKFLS
jgi:hypothetical protein